MPADWVCQDPGNMGFNVAVWIQIGENAAWQRSCFWPVRYQGAKQGDLHHRKMTNVPYFNKNACIPCVKRYLSGKNWGKSV